MDEEKKTPKAEEKTKKPKGQKNNVILVQTAVCAFLIFLVVVTGRLSPEAFAFIKDEYDEIMSVDMSANEVISSAMGAAQNVIGVKASAAEPEISEEAETEQTEENTEDKYVAVMAQLGESDGITVPVHGRISSEYGYRTNPISGAYALHTGVDIAADTGTPILAAYNGVVEDTGTGEKRGNYVLMLHPDGSETLYCHCSELLVSEGTVVRAGEAIALVGETGWATGPHLHFEIHRDGNAVDPLTVLKVKDGRV